jgi:radical SAM superfamily enzyme YgiQ (UPF0313 family)
MFTVLIANPALRFEMSPGSERYFFGAGCRFPWSLRKGKQEYPRFAMFPFFLGYTAGLLERDNFNVQVIDGVPLNLAGQDFIDKAVAISPDLILFEPATPAINRVSAIAKELKEKTGAKIAFAGSHVTTFPKETLKDYPHVDFAMIGEYEMSVLKLAQCLRDGSSYEKLPGFAFRNASGEFAGGQRGPEIDPVDQLPKPARHLFPAYFDKDLSRYHDGFCQNRPAIQLHSSRGCPFRCNFCLWIQVMYNNGKHRSFAASRVVDEMIEARDKYGAKEIYFDDDDFTVRKEHVFALCDEIKRRKVNLPWSVMGDAMATDVDTLERMADAGCIGMKFGLESADPAVLKRVGKPIKLDRVALVASTAQRLGIKTHMTVMFGLSGETHAAMEKTFAFACSLDVDSVQFSVATPYPGTRYYYELKEAGRLKFNQWEDFDGANNAVFEGSGLDPDFVERFEASAHGRWLRHKFKNPRWVLRQAKYFGRVWRGQGFGGMYKRMVRGYHLLVQSDVHRDSASFQPTPEIIGPRERAVTPRH